MLKTRFFTLQHRPRFEIQKKNKENIKKYLPSRKPHKKYCHKIRKKHGWWWRNKKYCLSFIGLDWMEQFEQFVLLSSPLLLLSVIIPPAPKPPLAYHIAFCSPFLLPYTSSVEYTSNYFMLFFLFLWKKREKIKKKENVFILLYFYANFWHYILSSTILYL